MVMTINSNINSLTAQKNLASSQSALATSIQRLSSGFRINGAKDDAAGLAISTSMNSQVNGLNQATRNANDGISLLQTADGALSQVSNMLQRMRDLSVQSANGTLGTGDRKNLDAEVQQLKTQIGTIASKTAFNNVALLSGGLSGSPLKLQVGANAGDSMSITVGRATLSGLGISATSIQTSGGASAAISAISTALNAINTNRANLGAAMNRLSYVVSLNQTNATNLSAASSQIQDTDYAAETANLTKNNILQQAGTSILAQANSIPQNVLSLLR